MATSLFLLVALLAVVSLLGLFVGAVISYRRTRVVGINEHVGLVRLARRARLWRLGALGFAVLMCVAVPVLGIAAADTTPGMVPALAGTLVVAVICVSEATFRRPMTTTRSAALRPRSLGDFVPRGWLGLATTTLIALAAVLTAGWVMAGPDDLGRAGTAFTAVCGDVTHTITPWPGSHYALPIATATAVSVALAVVTCLVIARRPSPAAESAELDSELRRWSIGAVLQSLTLVACLTLIPLLLLMARGARIAECADGDTGTLAILAIIGAGLAAVLAFVAFIALCTGPSVRVNDIPPPSRGDAAPVGVPR